MATAQREGGLYYVNGHAVDSEGKKLEGAPKQPKDSTPDQQPGAAGAINDPVARLAALLGDKLGGAKGEAKAEDADELPTVDELDAHLAGMTTVEEVRALKRRDKRVTAAPKYEARIAELKAQE